MTEHPDRNQLISESLEPMTKEILVSKLLFLRDDWLKDKGSRSYSRCDGRAPWYVAIAANLENAQEDKILPDSAKNEVNNYFKWYINVYKNRFEYPIINRSSEIDNAEKTINAVLKGFGIKSEENLEKDLANKFFMLRYDFSDVIPKNFVHSNDGMHKIRTGWLLAIAVDIETSLDENLLNHSVQNEAKSYIEWWSKEYSKEDNRKFVNLPGLGESVVNTQEDIDRGNLVLDKILKSFGFTPKN